MVGRLRLVALAGAFALLVVVFSGQVVAAHTVYRQGNGSMKPSQFFDLDSGKAGAENLVGPDLRYYQCDGDACQLNAMLLTGEDGIKKMRDGEPSYNTCDVALAHASTKDIPVKNLPDGTWLCVLTEYRINGNTWGDRYARVEVTHSPTGYEAFKFSYRVWA
jgi:hypothetical protein